MCSSNMTTSGMCWSLRFGLLSLRKTSSGSPLRCCPPPRWLPRHLWCYKSRSRHWQGRQSWRPTSRWTSRRSLWSWCLQIAQSTYRSLYNWSSWLILPCRLPIAAQCWWCFVMVIWTFPKQKHLVYCFKLTKNHIILHVHTPHHMQCSIILSRPP